MPIKAKFCPECGGEVESSHTFCEACGTDLRHDLTTMENSRGSDQTIMPNQQPSNISQPSMTQPGSNSLFSSHRMGYVVQEKFWGFGSGPIFDEQGKEIGRMKRKVFSVRERIEFQELDGSINGYIHRKILSIRPAHKLFDGQGREFARIEKVIFSLFKPRFELKDVNGKVLFTAVGKFMGWDFWIMPGLSRDKSQAVAEVHKIDRWRDHFFGGILDFKDTYAVKIHDPNVDRRTILGFVISIDNVLHDQNNNSGGFGSKF